MTSPSSDFLFCVIRLPQTLLTATGKLEGAGLRVATEWDFTKIYKNVMDVHPHIFPRGVLLFPKKGLLNLCYDLAHIFLILATTTINY